MEAHRSCQLLMIPCAPPFNNFLCHQAKWIWNPKVNNLCLKANQNISLPQIVPTIRIRIVERTWLIKFLNELCLGSHRTIRYGYFVNGNEHIIFVKLSWSEYIEHIIQKGNKNQLLNISNMRISNCKNCSDHDSSYKFDMCNTISKMVKPIIQKMNQNETHRTPQSRVLSRTSNNLITL